MAKKKSPAAKNPKVTSTKGKKGAHSRKSTHAKKSKN